MRNAASFLFPALLAVSLGLHFWVLQTGVPRIAATRESLPVESTEVFLLEERPAPSVPEPEAPLEETAPEPLPEPSVEPVAEAELTQTPEPEPIREAAEVPQMPAKEPIRPRPVNSKTKVQASQVAHVPTPVVLNNPAPTYPELARQKGWEGRAIVRVEVSPAGYATKVTIARSSGFGVLDQAALRAVKKWRFQPRTIAGQPAPGLVEVPVNFGLDR